MIIPFPRSRAPDPWANARHDVVSFWLCVWFWWMPRAPSKVIHLDDYRHHQKRRRAHA